MKKYSLFILAGIFFSCSQSPKKETSSSDSTAVQKPKGSGIEQMMSSEPDGDHIEKYENGMIKIRGYIMHGMREGQWASFYPDGKQWSETVFTKGKKNGPTTTWFDTGKKRYTGFYTDDNPSGKWIYWDENGNKVTEIDMSNGATPDSGKTGT